MSDLNKLEALIHNSRCEGRAIQKLYDLREEISQSVNEDKPDSQMYLLRNRLDSIIILLEYKR